MKSGPKKASKSNDSVKEPPPTTAAELSDIHLDGEVDERVGVYETCEDIRKKINQHLKMKGPKAGGHNPVFYAGFVYFEKLRIKQGKKKSAKREKMEELWKDKGGVPREGSHNIYVTCLPGERWTFDQYAVPKSTGVPTMETVKINCPPFRRG